MSEREPLVGAPRTIAKLYRELTAANAVVEAGKRIHYHLGHYRQSRGEKDYQQLRLADELLGEALDKLQGGS